MEKLAALLGMLGVNLLFLVVLGAVVAWLALSRRAAFAVLKRNFLAYFTSPIGYVFLCVFVCLTGFVAFWLPDFFNSNLANLDQLNRYLPLILWVFVPAITMSIWAEERRQGTDELLLTIPAADFDIVLGKYLAAVAIYTVSLLFSEVCNVLVLMRLGNPDIGLLLGNYLGYWLAGLAMVSIGMVASFLTSNLTVGFVLGMVLNMPLVATGYADVFFGPRFAVLGRWSISEQFTDFQGGVISLASIMYFLMVTAVMFYLCLVLIGRRHWRGGSDGNSLGLHYFVRFVCLVVFVGAACVLLSRWDLVRADVTSERLNSLHPATVELIRNLNPKYPPIQVDAFVSRDLPEEFVEKRIDLQNILRELKSLSGGKIATHLHEVDLFSAEAAQAKAEFGIDSQEVLTQFRGAETRKNIIFGVGVRSGLERVSVPFLGQGTRMEYELIRSIVTVGEPKRKRVGILLTDVNFFGGGGPNQDAEDDGAQDQPLIQELRKQYQVVKVDPSQPITERYDVLLAAQPSSLGPEPMKNFINAVKKGQPTAIFEDPFPFLDSRLSGTTAPKRPAGGMFMMQRPEAKGDMAPLWKLLGVKISETPDPQNPQADADVVWQENNPHAADQDRLDMSNQWVFVTPVSGADMPFSQQNPIVSNLQEVLLLYPGAIKDIGGVNREYVELIRTSRNAGTIPGQSLIRFDPFGRPALTPKNEIAKKERPGDVQQVLAVEIKRAAEPGANDEPAEKDAKADKKGKDSKDAKDAKEAKEPKDEKDKPEKDHGLNVVLVADVDVLYGAFFYLRSMGNDPRNPIRNWNLDNVPLVLNVIDHLAGDDRFLDIRKRRPQHRELTTVRALTEAAKKSRLNAREEAEKGVNKAETKEVDELKAKISKLETRLREEDPAARQEAEIAITDARQRLQRKTAEVERKREEQYRSIDRELAGQVQRVQDRYKMWAVLLPPVLPLLIALCVFLVRRSHESEGEAASRMV